MQNRGSSNLTDGQKRQTRSGRWLCYTAIGAALFAYPPNDVFAQSTTKQLMPSRSHSRQSILNAASPSSVAEHPLDENGERLSPEALAATRVLPARSEPPADEIQQVPEGFVQAENGPALSLDSEEFSARTAEQDQAPGIRIGTMILRPTISQGINSQSERQDGIREHRTYLTTSARGTLDSDWSRHALRITADGKLEHNLGGSDLSKQPQANIDADLRLDLGGDIEAHVLGGYRLEKEDVNSPNAIGGVQSQGTEHRVNFGGSVQKEFGTLRALAALDVSRTSYDDAKDFSGNAISLKERDRNEAMLRARLGYELSPALIPFLEVNGGVTRYDQKFDTAGYQRSSRTLGAKLGAEVNRGEKLSGELAVGYLTRSYDDGRLDSLGAVSIDALANWSPQRGTDVTLALRTTLDDFSNSSDSGWANYQFRAGLTHQIRSDLIGRLTAQAEYRNAQNVTEYLTGAGLTYSLNRYVDLTADLSYKVTPRYNSDDLIIGAGISLKR